MPQDINTILAGAKKTLGEAEKKFPSAPKPATSQTPNEYSHAPYSLVPAAKKAIAEAGPGPGVGTELKEKAKMVANARKALE